MEDPRIKNYSEELNTEKTGWRCDICGGEIYKGDYYLTNWQGKRAHDVCFFEGELWEKAAEWAGLEMNCMV